MKNKLPIGEYLLCYRKAHGLTQAALGELLGVSAAAVSKWELARSYPDLFLLPDISKLLGISIDALMGKQSTS